MGLREGEGPHTGVRCCQDSVVERVIRLKARGEVDIDSVARDCYATDREAPGSFTAIDRAIASDAADGWCQSVETIEQVRYL